MTPWGDSVVARRCEGFLGDRDDAGVFEAADVGGNDGLGGLCGNDDGDFAAAAQSFFEQMEAFGDGEAFGGEALRVRRRGGGL